MLNERGSPAAEKLRQILVNLLSNAINTLTPYFIP